AAWFEGHHGQGRTQVSELAQRLAVQPSLPGLPVMAEPGLAQAPAGLLPLDEDLDRRRAGPDQAVANPPAKAAPVSHQVQCLEHAALAAAVGAQQQIEAGTGRKRAALEAA